MPTPPHSIDPYGEDLLARAHPPSKPQQLVLPPLPTRPDPDGMPTKHMHVRWNPWELERLYALSRREGLSMQAWVRSRLRPFLLAERR